MQTDPNLPTLLDTENVVPIQPARWHPSMPTPREREIGKLGIRGAREALRRARPPQPRTFDPLPAAPVEAS